MSLLRSLCRTGEQERVNEGLNTRLRLRFLHSIAVRLLVVDDERDLTDALAEGFRSDGYAVDVAYDGDDALVKASVYPYDLVCLDLGLPGVDGREIARAIRSGERFDGAPPPRILMLTARDALEDRIGGLDDGADDYVVKPVDLGELTARVRALLRRSGSRNGAVLRVGPLELDAARHEARASGLPLRLAPREFGLLRYFMSHPGEVLSESHLLTHVWDENANPYTNTVRVTVMKLRRKLEAAGLSDGLIETVVGAGYRLREL
jgi:DNA-binding response OmpR family regulator